ncbi:N-acetyltransferase [Pseudomonas carnis]|jgi:phosphinothricin acetyltransferase|uniref:L-methionine sulfoximine/L-methionine sulfone acetyltransferase n=2 Tax=Pseudomonas TaxID=286 RepID=A0A109L869_PSEFL|nr:MULTISPECIES: GNAT family N-acetyltransferase [Pseudomonas]KWV82816.1 N-acyltransferase YncA [Pseudomonas fluorescens]MBA1255317.1 N-acetyltransferase [Pseudomonas carnis]MBA1268654.1 N-acetyltransferase [Pseudomonas carnis]MBA1300295.1 N-acetyltransferase [Pseudomonas carnis]MBC6624308.1 N-acetyltransferase [Pseudomonas sp.]|tara:strand:+ start:15 stop:527 length:513 start_codon:yes stop_codon:yes gene_type:complete
MIRDATEHDLPAIRAIYNDAVLNTTAIWNEQPVDLANRQAWFSARQAQQYPILVTVDNDEVTGYASFGDWRPFEGFRYSVEHSVYVRNDQRGKGLGPRLMQALIERARSCGKHVMVAAIESGNLASIRLHERLGFVTTGQMPQVGIKFGRWLDLTFMQLTLNPGAEPPQE